MITDIRGLPAAIRALLSSDDAALREALTDDAPDDRPVTVAEVVAADAAAD